VDLLSNINVILSLLTKIAIYGTFIISFNVFIVGKTGYWAVGHLASFGIGTLMAGILGQYFSTMGYSLVWCAGLISIVMGAALALIPALATFRLRGDYFILVSIGVCEVVRVTVEGITGPGGLSNVPRPFGIQSDIGMLSASLFAVVIAAIFSYTFQRHRFETLLSLTRSREKLALTCGIDVWRQRIGVFVFAGALAGAAGALFAFYSGGTDPQRFSLLEAVELFVLAMLAGVGTVSGSLAASTLFVLVTFSLQSLFREASGAIAPKLADIVFGILLIVTAKFSAEGKERNAI
jgi:branched-chain amino acid transport system permease protein